MRLAMRLYTLSPISLNHSDWLNRLQISDWIKSLELENTIITLGPGLQVLENTNMALYTYSNWMCEISTLFLDYFVNVYNIKKLTGLLYLSCISSLNYQCLNIFVDQSACEWMEKFKLPIDSLNDLRLNCWFVLVYR